MAVALAREDDVATQFYYDIPGQREQYQEPVISGTWDPASHAARSLLDISGLELPLVDANPGGEEQVAEIGLPHAPHSTGPTVRWRRLELAGTTHLDAASLAADTLAHPVLTFTAVIFDPNTWMGILRGAQPAAAPGSPKGQGGALVEDVVVSQKGVTSLPAALRVPLQWLLGYWQLTAIPAEITARPSGLPARIELVHLPPGTRVTPGGISRWLPPPADAETVTLTIGKPNARSRSKVTGRLPSFPQPSASDAPLAVSSVTSSARHCEMAGSTGLTAGLIATPGEKITGAIDAQGCDIGVYVGRGANGTVIENATITGARGHGILVEDSSHVTVSHDHVTVLAGDDGLQQVLIPEDKAVTLAGSSYSTALDNYVEGQYDGGIAVVDTGLEDPAALNPSPIGAPATHDTVTGNVLARGNGGCGIILASYDSGQPVSHDEVVGNTLTDVSPGAIVVAADSPGASTTDNSIESNTITITEIPGIMVHSNAPSDVLSGTIISGNRIGMNGPDGSQGLSVSTGIALIGDFSPIADTAITGNVISGDALGIWEARATATTQSANVLTAAPPAAKLVISTAKPTPTGFGTKPG